MNNILFYMSVTGSIPLTAYFIVRFLMKRKVTAAMYYILLLISMVFFLLPFPLFSIQLRSIGLQLHPTEAPFWVNNPLCTALGGYSNVYYQDSAKRNFNWIITIWLIVTIFMLLRTLINYYKLRRDAVTYSALKKIVNVSFFCCQRKVEIYESAIINSPFTIGFLHPIILLPGEAGAKEEKYILLHELSHVQYMDFLICLLAILIRCVHWFNPLAHILLYEIKKQQEFLADEQAMKQLKQNERKIYGQIIFDAILHTQSDTIVSPYVSSFNTTSFRSTKERIERLKDNMRKSEKKSFIIIMFILASIVFNLLPIMAFAMPAKIQNDSLPLNCDIDSIQFFDFVTSAENTSTPNSFFTESNMVFIDKDGISTPIAEEQLSYENNARACVHTWKDGVIQKHIKYTDGSCDVIAYNARQCIICKTVVLGTRVSTTHFDKCPH